MSTWLRHMLPRRSGPGPACHSHVACAPYGPDVLPPEMFGLILACAFAADTPTIIAKTLKPAIKARFIRTPPFRQENATLFIGSINNNKIKEADGRGRPIFGSRPGKIFINAASFIACKD